MEDTVNTQLKKNHAEKTISSRLLTPLVLLCALAAGFAGAQSHAWVSTWSGPIVEPERGEYVCMDADHNVYVAGRKIDDFGAEDYLIVKYNRNGEEQWSRTYDGGTNNGFGFDRPAGIGVDMSGNVYVTGRSRAFRDPFYIYDFVTIKYDGSGAQQWLRRFRTIDGGEDVDDIPYDMHVDAAGNLVITGDSNNSFLTVKYNAAGVEQWHARFDEPASGVGIATAVDVDPTGNAYIVGFFQDDNAHPDYVTIKYSPSGVRQWTTRYHVDQAHIFEATDIAVDGLGNVAVTGYTCLGGSTCQDDYDITTVLYDDSGSQVWARSYSGPGDGSFVDDFGEGVALDADGNVFVVGSSYQQAGHQLDILTLKYTAGGAQAWMRVYNQTTSAPTSADSYDRGHDIAVDGNGNVYVTGGCHAEQSVWFEERLTTLSYDNAGTLLWVDQIDPNDNLPNDPQEGLRLSVDVDGNVAVTGYSFGVSTFEDCATVFFASPSLLFLDGFEIGNTSKWSNTIGD